mgnify:FL=1|jgi:hypothetical protein|tara:strand:- start:261 stop:476 length:216 start_codon:yes stop_codon:yes gene_type:complete
MKEYNETSVIVACKNLLDNSDDVLGGNAVSTKNCLYWDTHNSLIDAIGLLGGDVTEYSYIDPDNPDMEGRT